MTEDLRVPARQSGDGREWPRMKPVFSVLAVMLAIMGGACQFAYQFKTHWTPLQRLYFPTFFETAHLAAEFPREFLGQAGCDDIGHGGPAGQPLGVVHLAQ